MQPINAEAKFKQLLAELNKKSAKAKAKKRAEEQANRPIVKVKLTKKQNRIACLPSNRENNYKVRFNAYSSLSNVQFNVLPRKLKKAIKQAKNEQVSDFEKLVKLPQKVSKKVSKFIPITDKTLLRIQLENATTKVVNKKSKAVKATNSKSLVCITNGTNYKRLPMPEAIVFTQDAGWKFCSKTEYKNWVKLQPSKILTSKDVKLSKKQAEENEKLVVRNARRYARQFKQKEKLNTFSRETKIKLEEAALQKERVVFKRGKLGEPMFTKKKRAKITQEVLTPSKEVVLTSSTTTLPKSISKWNKRKFKTSGIAPKVKAKRQASLEKK